MLIAGQPAPDFSIPNSEMKMINLADFRGQNVVLYFYPKDDTTGCTIEAIEFTDLMDDFADQETVVVSVSRDNCVSHAAFRDKHGISVELLADVEGELCEKYGVWQERESHGEKKNPRKAGVESFGGATEALALASALLASGKSNVQ